jgi:hypothetical protein
VNISTSIETGHPDRGGTDVKCFLKVVVAAGVVSFLLTGCASNSGPTEPLSNASGAPFLAVDGRSGPSTAARLLTPISMAPIGDPLVVLGSDGVRHIDFDLLITNAFTAPVTLTNVTAQDDNGVPIFHIAGAALAAVTQGNFFQQPVVPSAQIPASGQVSVQIDVKVSTGAELPRALTQIVGWQLPADAPALALLGGKTTGRTTGPTLPVSRIQPEVVAPPLPGGGWLSLNGCCQPNAHRSLRVPVDGTHEVKPEMFAVDWVQLQNGTYFTGDGSTNGDYPYIGADELAVANGTVVKTRDGMPNETPNEPPQYVKTADDYIGNSVVIKIRPNRYAVYGHMLAGSITVKVGDRVKTGDIVGKLGNSGNSTAAHLHFVVIDSPDFVTATSIPFVIKRWTLEGSAMIPHDGPPITVQGPSTPQTRTHPLYLSVADFN